MKQNIVFKSVLFLLIIVGTWSCERDDICADITPTTPHLIIRFYDIGNPDNLKQVRQLSVRGFDENGAEIAQDIFAVANKDSIVLPLRFGAEGIATTSEFVLEKNRDYALDTDPVTISNIDKITVSYTPEFKYVSRACGYRSVFTNVSIVIDPDSSNWILANEIVTTTIENETQAHILLRH